MLTSSPYLQSGAPTGCCFCGRRFPIMDGHAQAFRTSSGQYYCSEFCAEDAAEAAFRRRKSN
jgi:hypothetical protein